MTKSETLAAVVKLPKAFYEMHTISPHDLLVASGYYENFEKISVEDIHQFLRTHIEEIGYWFRFSEDKRASGGWLIEAAADGEFEVRLVRGGAPKHRFSSREMACAYFIKNELEWIREN